MSNKKLHRELSVAGVMVVAALLLTGCDDTTPVDIAPGDSPVGEQILDQADGDGVPGREP